MTNRTVAIDAGVAAALFAIALAAFSVTWDVIFEPRDEGYLLTQGARVADGALPHRDFIDVYGPGVHGVTGAALAAGDGQILPVRRMLGVWKAAAVVLTFATVRLVTGIPWAIFAAVGAMVFWGRPSWNLNAPYASLFTIPLCQLGLWLLMLSERRQSPRLRFAAGIAAGAAVLFKHSLAILVGFGMLLAIIGIGLVTLRPDPESAGGATSARSRTILWIVAALLPMVPFLAQLDLRSYLQHLLPIHAAMTAVWWATRHADAEGPGLGDLARRAAPWLAGAAVFPIAMLGVYAVAGSLGPLVFDMLTLPRLLVNYAKPAPLPSATLAVAMLGAVVAVGGSVVALGGRRWSREALAVAVVGGLVGILSLRDPDAAMSALGSGPDALEGVLLAVTGWAAIATFAWPLARGRTPAGQPPPELLIPLLFFHLFLCFQGFPRSGPDVQLTQGAQMMMWAILLPAWLDRAVPVGAPARVRAGALAILALIPLWILWPVVDLAIASTKVPMRELRFESAAGIRLERSAIQVFGIDEIERVVDHLAERDDDNAPIALIGNVESIGFLSGRRSFFDAQHAYVFWAGWEMMPPELMAEIDQAELVRRLEQQPGTVVIDVADRAGRAISAALPELRQYIDDHYEVDVRYGPYRVLRRRD